MRESILGGVKKAPKSKKFDSRQNTSDLSNVKIQNGIWALVMWSEVGYCCWGHRSGFPPVPLLLMRLKVGGQNPFCALIFLRFQAPISVACIQFLFAKYNLIYLQITIKFEIYIAIQYFAKRNWMTSQAYKRKAGGSLPVNNQKHKIKQPPQTNYIHYIHKHHQNHNFFPTPKQTSINKGRLLILRKKWRGGGVGGVAELVRMV